VTEVPDHLLRRSQERRAALGGGGEGGGEPPATPGEAPGTGAAASAVEPAGGAEVAPAAAAPVEEPPKPLPPYVQAAVRRPKVPKFALPILAALPVWALVYAGTFATPGEALDPELALGKEIYSASCSGCHGGGGEGGTGRPLAGQVLLTFPNKADHLAWVHNGSPAAGTPYGNPDRPGGQRVSQTGGFGAMPAFEGTLSEEEIAAVVRYEREVLGGGEPEPSGEEATESDSGGGTGSANAEQQGGDVGGDSDDESQTSTTTESGSKAGGGTGSGTGGDNTSTTSGE
jgi:mono/diheme cytochrome c family protein